MTCSMQEQEFLWMQNNDLERAMQGVVRNKNTDI